MEKLKIAVGTTRTQKIWKNIELSWEDLVERLRTTTRTAETQGEFLNMPKSQQDNIKDVGGFVGGRLIGGKRKAGNVDKRYILALDADFADNDFCDTVHLFTGYTYCIYSTHKHTSQKPRLRLLIPLSRPVTADEYEAIARLSAKDIGIDMFDDSTYQAHRIMYWPSTSIDGEYIFEYEKGEPLDVDYTLKRYEDWTDVSSWPVSSRTINLNKRALKKQEDPTSKKGIVGAFCRTYDIEDAINKFLSGTYTKCDTSNRYTYVNGSTAAGLVIYENGKFAYSNHATDPTGRILCNAFDLVRIHKFGFKDDEATVGTPTVKLPSYAAMQELATKDKAVIKLIHKERKASAAEDFKNITIDDNNDSWAERLCVSSKGLYLPTIDNCKIILENDNNIKNKIALNILADRYKVRDILPWDNDFKNERDWTDADDAALRHYFEKLYNITNSARINDALTIVAEQNKYHPIKDYLNSVVWDKTERVESIFIDYLGAADNPYTRKITRITLIGAVARIFEAGCKFDTMLVLAGPQGCGKSYIINKLAKDWGSDTITYLKGREAYEELQGFWIIEFAELDALKKADIETIKHFITKSSDAYRAAYGKRVEDHARQCIFIGTTNTSEFLRDSTGNRRFYPIDVFPENKTKDIWKDLNDYEISQIWAEAVHYYKSNEDFYLSDKEIQKLAKIEQEKHFEGHPLTNEIERFLNTEIPDNWDEFSLSDRRAYMNDEFKAQKTKGHKREKVCVMEIWLELLNGDKKDLTPQKSREIKNIIEKTGEWEKATIRFGKIYGRQRGFIRIK